MATLRTVAKVALTTTTEAKLAPTVNAAVMQNLRAYADVTAELAVLEVEKDRLKGLIREAREKTGSNSWEFEGGWKTSDVRGTTTTVNLDKMVEDGVITQAQREEYTTITPKKPYENITIPKEFKAAKIGGDKPAKKPAKDAAPKKAKLHRQRAR